MPKGVPGSRTYDKKEHAAQFQTVPIPKDLWYPLRMLALKHSMDAGREVSAQELLRIAISEYLERNPLQ